MVATVISHVEPTDAVSTLVTLTSAGAAVRSALLSDARASGEQRIVHYIRVDPAFSNNKQCMVFVHLQYKDTTFHDEGQWMKFNTVNGSAVFEFGDGLALPANTELYVRLVSPTAGAGQFYVTAGCRTIVD